MEQNTKECPYCHSIISKDAKVCPSCGSKQPKTLKDYTLYFLYALIAISIIGLIYTNLYLPESKPTEFSLPEQNETPKDSEAIERPESSGSLGIGQTLSIDGIDYTLNSVSEWAGDDYYEPEDGCLYLIFNFTVTNTTQDDKDTIDIAFSGRADGHTMEQDYLDYFNSDSYGYYFLGSGESQAQEVVFQVPEIWSEFKLQVEDESYGGLSGVFTIFRDQVNEETIPAWDNYAEDHHEGNLRDNHHREED